MYYLKKRLEISGAHYLDLPYESKCRQYHGHNWIITVYCKSLELNKEGMIVDFASVKSIVMQLDHSALNPLISQPTAENIARWLCEQIPYCYKVEVQESEGNSVCYIK